MKLRKSITAVLVTLMCTTAVSSPVYAKEETNNVVGTEINQTTQEADIKNDVILNNTVVITQSAIGNKEEAYSNAVGELTPLSANTKKSTKVSSKAVVKKPVYTKAELRLMSCLIFCEAGGEPYAGKLAVGIVVMNRKKSRNFPNTIKGVIYQKYQFGPARNGSLNRALKRYDNGKFNSSAEKSCITAAKSALKGEKTVTYRSRKINMKNYLYFSGYVKNRKLTIAGHQFK